MEIACDILKKSITSTINKHDDLKKKFRSLNLSDISRKSNMDSFLKLINSKKYMDITNEFIEKYFDNANNDTGLSILMAYYISSYSDVLFPSYKTRFEQKLILSANKVVLLIEKLLHIQDDDFPDKFYNEFLGTIDHYYSLYKLWKSRDSINEMSDLFENIQEVASIIKIQLRKQIPTDKYDYLITQMNTLFELNPKYALRIMLHNYNIFNGLQLFETKFWDKVVSVYQSNKDAMFVILVAELRIRLIPLLSNPLDRKDIYYGLDTEDIINKIRNYDLDNKKIIEIINILQDKIKKINNNFINQQITHKISEKDMILLFKNMFHSSFD